VESSPPRRGGFSRTRRKAEDAGSGRHAEDAAGSSSMASRLLGASNPTRSWSRDSSRRCMHSNGRGKPWKGFLELALETQPEESARRRRRLNERSWDSVCSRRTDNDATPRRNLNVSVTPTYSLFRQPFGDALVNPTKRCVTSRRAPSPGALFVCPRTRLRPAHCPCQAPMAIGPARLAGWSRDRLRWALARLFGDLADDAEANCVGRVPGGHRSPGGGARFEDGLIPRAASNDARHAVSRR